MSGDWIWSRPGCDRPVDCRGLCQTHYNQIRFEGRVCSEEGCQRTQKATGLCQLHYNQQRLAGQVCEVDGCDRPVRAAGHCTLHYDRRRAYGKWNGEIGYCECGCGVPTEVSTITDSGRGAVIGKPRRFLPGHNARAAMSPDAVRVERREFPTPCWIWQRGKTNGYGIVSAGSQARYAHRLAYERAKGPVPDGWHVHHLCWKKTCVTPIT